MTDDALPGDYDAEDGMGDDGIECCPACGQSFHFESGHRGPVFDQRGREFETILDTDPGKGPFFCPECWPQLEANRNASENESLDQFQ